MNSLRLAALIAAVSVASVAPATVITRSYITTATFATGPAGPSVVLNFTLTYDPTSAVGATVSGYSSSSPLAAFQPTVGVQVNPNDGNGIEILLYRTLNGTPVYAGTNDYYSNFYVDANGTPVTIANGTYGGQFAYATSSTNTFFYSQSSFTVLAGGGTTPTGPGGTGTGGSAAPEPASWAMMIVGFGAVGAAMRRRGVASSLA